jgi:hypothetical protein
MAADDKTKIVELGTATMLNDVDKVLDLLSKGYSQFITRWEGWGNCPIHEACMKRADPVILKMFLKYPDLDVNVQSRHTGSTVFAYACDFNNLECAKLLLADSRVNLHTPDFRGVAPLGLLMFSKHDTTMILKYWIASGRFLTNEQLRTFSVLNNAHLRQDAFALVQAYSQNPAKATREARFEVGEPGFVTAYLFAMVVFLCDDFMVLKSPTPEQDAAARFWNMAKRMPLDIQIILMCRAAGSGKDSISKDDRESAFQDLALHLLENP